jgi:hypothetical protein
MTFLQVHDGQKLLLISSPPGALSYSTDDDVPRSVGDVQRTGDAAIDWDDDWIAPTLLNGWKDYGQGYTPTGYRRLPGGIVQIRGLVYGGSAATATSVFVLPVGYRPANLTIHVTYGFNQVYRLNVAPTGSVNFTTGNTQYMSLECQFFADDWEFS